VKKTVVRSYLIQLLLVTSGVMLLRWPVNGWIFRRLLWSPRYNFEKSKCLAGKYSI